MNPVRELEMLWKQDPAGPHIVTFLQQRGLSLLCRLEVIRRDQKLRWLSPQPWLAEEYLRQLSPNPDGIDWTLELVAGEYLSRPDDQTLTADELESRFPQLTGLATHLIRGGLESSADRKVDRVCDLFESLYRSGSCQPKLEYALAGLEVEHRWDGLRQLVEVELEFRSKELPRISVRELLQKFPLYEQVTHKPAGTGAVVAPTVRAGAATSLRPQPATIGKYEVVNRLGEGGFGVVYKAVDAKVGRFVAIKVPTKRALEQGNAFEEYKKEARTAAQLKHSCILEVYEFGESEEFPFYIVTPYMEGGTLAARMQRERISLKESARLIAAVASGLDHAYRNKLRAHRDIKPANILLDRKHRPVLADFGLALRERPRGSDTPGTPAYMSPEQAGNLGHLVDERSDIFSLGIVFYELLTGERPFSGRDNDEIREQICSGIFKSPRDLDDRIPKELERICLKMMATRRESRYQRVRILRKELREFLKEVVSCDAKSVIPATNAVAVNLDTAPGEALDTGPSAKGPDDESRLDKLPGLRAFDDTYGDSFLQLLPGLRDRQNLPESVSWWKLRLEERCNTKAFRVGGMMGPSGCGKSSLIRAGILPRLNARVASIVISAAPDNTEKELQSAICSLSGLSLELSLADTIQRIRCGEGLPADCKLVLVLDQFEQWLQAHKGNANSELCSALKQCDGGRVQAVLLVRDDFYSPLTHFLENLSVGFVKDQNFCHVELFARDHARHVLRLFGVAYGRLPRKEGKLTDDQRAFLDGAIDELSEEGKVICVRLALFARMFKDRDWTPGTLTDLGGAAGVGCAFLEETFSSRHARPEYRDHQQAATEVLKMMIRGYGTHNEERSEIRGRPYERSALQQVSGYVSQPRKFAKLLEILDGDLRLITPVGTESLGVTSEVACYQLTHDYLVPSIRKWLGMHQTVEEQILEDRTGRWSRDRESRQLPSLGEWLRIRIRTNRHRWTDEQKEMMLRARREHVLRSGIVLAVFAVLLLVIQAVRTSVARGSFVGQIQNANPSMLPEVLAEADGYGADLDNSLHAIIEVADQPTADKASKLTALPARLVVVLRDRSQLDPLEDFLLTGELAYVDAIRTRLRLFADDLKPRWLTLLRSTGEPASRRFRAALGLVGLDRKQELRDLTVADLTFVATELCTSFSEYQPQLRDLLRPIGKQMVSPLMVLFDAETASADQQISAAAALADFAKEDTELLGELLTRANAKQFKILYPLVDATTTGPVRDKLLALVEKQPDENLRPLERVSLGRRRANAAIVLLRQGDHKAFFNALRITDDSESSSQFIHRCRSFGVMPEQLIDSFDSCESLRDLASGMGQLHATRVMYALLIALGSYKLEQIPEGSREKFLGKLLELYKNDPSATIHSASGWLLREWGRSADVAEADQVEVPYDKSGVRDWFRLRIRMRGTSGVGSEFPASPRIEQEHSLTFVVFPAGKYTVGSPDNGLELKRETDEKQDEVDLKRFALCDREVTWDLYEAFKGDRKRTTVNGEKGWALDKSSAACAVTWLEWREFCRWLTSQRFGDDESRQCYDAPSQLERDSRGNPKDNGAICRERCGFRMPSQGEWEVGARAGQRTAYSFGSDETLLGDYAWFMDNVKGVQGECPQVSGVKRPGLGGLHDTHGNLSEWVHDEYQNTQSDGGSPDQGDLLDIERVLRGGCWNNFASGCRSAKLFNSFPTAAYPYFGLRLAMTVD